MGFTQNFLNRTIARFWTIMAFLLASVVIFCADSPLVPQKFASDRPYLAWLIILLFTFMVNYIIRLFIVNMS